MDAKEIAQASIKAWEVNNVREYATLFEEICVFRGFLPQPRVEKEQYISFMRAMMRAFPDWSFGAHLLDENTLSLQEKRALFSTSITGTHTGDLFVPGIPTIPPTGQTITLPAHHLEFITNDKLIIAVSGDFSPNALEEVLAQLGMQIPK